MAQQLRIRESRRRDKEGKKENEEVLTQTTPYRQITKRQSREEIEGYKARRQEERQDKINKVLQGEIGEGNSKGGQPHCGLD